MKLPHHKCIIFFIFFFTTIYAEDDVKCLQRFKTSFSDPLRRLSSWTFKNTTARFICNFVGVDCWNDRENRLTSLQLRDFNLDGKIPDALQFCSSLATLDLSGNSISGAIPIDICSWLPFLVSLNLSNNSLSGRIPPELDRCVFLNTLNLGSNQLSGNIPFQLSSLHRLTSFSVADNELTGSVPSLLARFGKDSFDGNHGLCSVWEKCSRFSKKNLEVIVAAGFCGAVGSMLLGLGVWWCYFSRAI